MTGVAILQGVALVLFIMLIATPAWFFRKIERYLFNDVNIEEKFYIPHINPLAVVKPVNVSHTMDDDERRLDALLRQVYRTMDHPEANRVWMNKYDEMKRKIRWKAIEAL